MKAFVPIMLVCLANAAKIPNTYLPPNSAAPRTTFNNAAQPHSFQQGSHNGFGSLNGGAFNGNPKSHGHNTPSGPQIPILAYNNINNGDGTYHFDYATGNGIQQNEDGHLNHAATGEGEQVVQGSYSYTGDDGQTYTVHYKADGNGFQPIGDHLPTPPPIPEAIQRSLEYNAAHPEENNAGSYNAGNYGGSSFGANGRGSFGSGPGGPQGTFKSFSGSTQNQYLPPQHQAGSASGYHY